MKREGPANKVFAAASGEDHYDWLRFGMVKKTVLLLASLLVVSMIWFSGFDLVYAKALTGASNTLLGLAGRETRIEVGSDNGNEFFRVNTVIEGRGASYPQTMGALLLPVVMVVAWQIFMAFFLRRKRWIKYTLINTGIFSVIQVIFLLLLSAYYTSLAAKYVYDMMMDSFYVIALVIILIDNIRHPVFLSLLGVRDR